LLREGRVVARGKIATVLTSANLALTFGAKVKLTIAGGRYALRVASPSPGVM
jgi:ABC-type hemin transport system ATPase subunit